VEGQFQSTGENAMKKLLVTLVLLGASIASAKTYNVSLQRAAIGTGQIQAGESKLELKGERIVLKDGRNSDEFLVVVENEERKFAQTSVTYRSEEGSSRIQEIRLGGTTLKLVFTN
jgi:hypothetical protein